MVDDLPIFPCRREDKRPLSQRGFHDATSFASIPEGWPLVGVATGEGSGLDCLDIDAEGIGWYDREFDALPFTRAHETRSGGLHLLFRHAEGLRCSTSRIAPGVDVRADGGYIIWWPREGLPFEDHPLCEWPGWLLKAAMTPKRKVPTAIVGSGLCVTKDHRQSVGMVGLHAAVGMEALGTGSGVDRGTVEPSTTGHSITRKSTTGKCGPWRHTSTNTSEKKSSIVGLPSLSTTWSLKPRLDCVQRTVERAKPGNRNACLFWAACVYAEIIVEGKLKPELAMSLLISAAMTNGLLKEDGRERCKATILSGFRTVEMKVLEVGGRDEYREV
jgi:hypothetical protein